MLLFLNCAGVIEKEQLDYYISIAKNKHIQYAKQYNLSWFNKSRLYNFNGILMAVLANIWHSMFGTETRPIIQMYISQIIKNNAEVKLFLYIVFTIILQYIILII